MPITINAKNYEHVQWEGDREGLPQGALLLLSDTRGVYIPRDFISEYAENLNSVENIDFKALSDPYNETYWDEWDSILNNRYLIATDGKVYSLYQDGDLWALPMVEA